MARADRRRAAARRAHAAARATRRDSDLAAIEDTLFFTRIREPREVGVRVPRPRLPHRLRGLQRRRLGNGGGIGDLLRDGGNGTSGNISVSDAREQVQKNPKSAQAQRNLATALETDGQTDEAIVGTHGATSTLKPKDQDSLRELAGLHLGQGSKFARGGAGCPAARQLLHVRRHLRRAARPRQGRHDRARPDRRGDRDPGQPDGQRGLHQGPNGVPERGADVRAARRARAEGSRTSSSSSPRRRSRAATPPRRSLRIRRS